MKVLLTAFNGKLMSEPMDWPENTSHEIMLIMDFDLTPSFNEEDFKSPSKTTHKRGRFVSTSRTVFMGPLQCREYKLVDVS